MKYLIELHDVPHELILYVEELKLYGEVTHHRKTFVWLESFWEIDILQSVMGVKQVYPKRFDVTPISVTHNRGWTELLGTKWEANPV